MSESASSGVDPETHMITPPVPGPTAPSEPVLSAASLVTIATAILSMVTAFVIPVPDDKQAAILGAIAVLAPVILGLIARARAWAPQTVRQTVKAEVTKALREYRQQPPTGGTW